MSFLDKENKALLWGILQENHNFNGLSNDKFSIVHKKFEDIISYVNREYNNVGLLEKNKTCISMSINMINKEKEHKSKIQMIYKAEDLQNERQNKMNEDYNNQKQNLNAALNPNKPQDINFKDKDDENVDRPIGDEMDTLIAERMASRERELEIPEMSDKAKQWVNNDSGKLNITNSNELAPIKEEKKVSFKEDEQKDKFDIFSKLKKIPESKDIDFKVELIDLLNNLSNKTKEINMLFSEIEEITEKIKQLHK